MKQKKFKKRFVFRPARLFKHLVLILVAFISAFPFYWMLSAATNNTTDIIKGHMLPGNYLLENWMALTAASIALPPAASTAAPASTASGCGATIIARGFGMRRSGRAMITSFPR